MTQEQLDEIEATLQVTLPASYRAVSLALPRLGGEMFDKPTDVIGATRFPLENGDYDRANWKSSFLAIGRSGSGDLYLLDLALDASPVFYLSHEDHSITAEWPSLEAFVADRKDTAIERERRTAEQRRQVQFLARQRRMLIAILLLSLGIAVILLIWLGHTQ